MIGMRDRDDRPDRGNGRRAREQVRENRLATKIAILLGRSAEPRALPGRNDDQRRLAIRHVPPLFDETFHRGGQGLSIGARGLSSGAQKRFHYAPLAGIRWEGSRRVPPIGPARRSRIHRNAYFLGTLSIMVALLSIGRHALPGRAVLAPMSGVTDHAFRQIAEDFGAGMVVSEMVAADQLAAGEEEARLRAEGRGLRLHVVQLAGCTPEDMAKARASRKLQVRISSTSTWVAPPNAWSMAGPDRR